MKNHKVHERFGEMKINFRVSIQCGKSKREHKVQNHNAITQQQTQTQTQQPQIQITTLNKELAPSSNRNNTVKSLNYFV